MKISIIASNAVSPLANVNVLEVFGRFDGRRTKVRDVSKATSWSAGGNERYAILILYRIFKKVQNVITLFVE